MGYRPESHEGRREARVDVRILATLRWYGGELGVMISNLSSQGAMVRGGELPEQGTEVVLDVAGAEIVATLAWVRPPHCGLSFHRAVDTAALRERARQSRGGARRHASDAPAD